MQAIPEQQAKERIASVIARYFDKKAQTGTLFINLGVGIPTMVADYVTSPSIYVQGRMGCWALLCCPEGRMDHTLSTLEGPA